MDATGYAYVRSMAEAAAKSNGTSRCSQYVYDTDDEWWADDYYYYYYGDDVWPSWGSSMWGNKWDDDYDDDVWNDDKHTFTSSSSGSSSSSDRDSSYEDILGDRIRRRRHRHRHLYMSWAIFASGIAVLVLLVTFCALYYKFKGRLQGNESVKYSPVHTDDPGDGVSTSRSTRVVRLSVPSYGAATSQSMFRSNNNGTDKLQAI
jgi:hypothetical protein